MKLKLIAHTLLCSSLLLTGCSTTTSSDSKLGEKDPKKVAELRTTLAAEYIRTGQLDKAKNELDAALQINSRSAEANAMMGVLLQREGSPVNIAKADQYFRRAIAENGKDSQIRNNYGTYLFQIGRYAEAAEQFKIAGTTLGYELRFRSLENLGLTYLKLNNTTSAEQAFKQAIDVSPANAVIAKIELAEMYYYQKNFGAASTLYEDYVRRVGQSEQGARALWIGVRLARANGDQLGMQVLANQLRAQFPESAEYKRYIELKNSSSEAIWK